jgi:hypothetical protein
VPSAIISPADLAGDLDDVTARFQDQRGIGGDAVDHAGGGQLLDLVDFGGVDKEFHAVDPCARAVLASLFSRQFRGAP